MRKEKLNSARSAAWALPARSRWACLTRRKKEYFSRNTRAILKLAAFTGNITRKEGKPYLHLHPWYSEILGRMSVWPGAPEPRWSSAPRRNSLGVLPGSVGRRMDDEVD